MKLNFNDVVTLVSSDSGGTKAQVEAVIKSLSKIVQEETAKGNSLGIPKFGVFKQKILKARQAHVPSTGQKIQVPERRTFKFSVA